MSTVSPSTTEVTRQAGVSPGVAGALICVGWQDISTMTAAQPSHAHGRAARRRCDVHSRAMGTGVTDHHGKTMKRRGPFSRGSTARFHAGHALKIGARLQVMPARAWRSNHHRPVAVLPVRNPVRCCDSRHGADPRRRQHGEKVSGASALWQRGRARSTSHPDVSAALRPWLSAASPIATPRP
jgi:hypothetical protein